MGDMGPRGAINMGGRDLKEKGFSNVNFFFFGTVHVTQALLISDNYW